MKEFKSYKVDNAEAIEFLSKNAEAKFDFSAAGPLNCWVEDSAILPEKLRNLFVRAETSVDKEDLAFDGRKSRGQKFLLESFVNFFRRYDVNCDINNVSLSRGILNSITEILFNFTRLYT